MGLVFQRALLHTPKESKHTPLIVISNVIPVIISTLTDHVSALAQSLRGLPQGLASITAKIHVAITPIISIIQT